MELVASCSIALVCFKRDRFSIFTFVLTPRTKYFEVNNVINKEGCKLSMYKPVTAVCFV